MTKLHFEDEVYRISGAAFEVHNTLGIGFLEAVYQECLVHEFRVNDIPFVAQKALTLSYKGAVLTQTYQADFVCFESIIVEIKACPSIVPAHRAQLLNYLKATGLSLGLIINFGTHPKAQIERFAL
ncbi:GxxExxY protein [Asticcacaulis sp. DW145]|uniref:GxxExxY protein n=1 Tax=Asticcacaulis currens TaxID=2984210 RepID=A0ABT5IGX0_9CAUL|nr:GxxExxY protein [Asticcacaulis currens]MDC7695110.1 GxxExxY protein [Asticcacaulis currens]BEV12763.1 GxxExxY protein [Asticcacaulis sp. DW145]